MYIYYYQHYYLACHQSIHSKHMHHFLSYLFICLFKFFFFFFLSLAPVFSHCCLSLYRWPNYNLLPLSHSLTLSSYHHLSPPFHSRTTQNKSSPFGWLHGSKAEEEQLPVGSEGCLGCYGAILTSSPP